MVWRDILLDFDEYERASRLRFARGSISALGVVYILSFGLSLINIESVMGTGVLLSFVGVLAARGSFRCGASAGVVAGALAVVLSLSLFVAVNAYGWSPSEAEMPFAIIGGVAMAAFGGLNTLTRQQLTALATPMRPTPISTSTLLPVPERSRSGVDNCVDERVAQNA
jgi:hypothetical protein